MTLPSRPVNSWTIAYRMSKYANHFRRVTNWAGTWSESRLMAVEFEAHNPGAEVWFVATSEYESYQREMVELGAWEDSGLSDDWGNILVTETKRVAMRETGEVTPGMIESVKAQSTTENQRDTMHKTMAEDAVTKHVAVFPGPPVMSVVADDMNNVGRYADVRGDTSPESRKWLVVGAVKAEGQHSANFYAVVWRGDANRVDTARVVHRDRLTNLY